MNNTQINSCSADYLPCSCINTFCLLRMRASLETSNFYKNKVEAITCTYIATVQQAHIDLSHLRMRIYRGIKTAYQLTIPFPLGSAGTGYCLTSNLHTSVYSYEFGWSQIAHPKTSFSRFVVVSHRKFFRQDKFVWEPGTATQWFG